MREQFAWDNGAPLYHAWMRPHWVVGVVVVFFGCERAPNVKVPDAFKGGFLMQCFGVTDFLRRGPCDPNKTSYMHNNRGGCVCAQGGGGPDAEYFTLPPVVNGRATSALPFKDTACTSTYASACIPRVVVLNNGDWNEGVAGQLRLDSLVDRLPNTMLGPSTAELLGIGTNDSAVAARVAMEAENNLENYCGYAHFGVLAELLFPGIGRPSLEWQQNARDMALSWGDVTTFLDGLDLQLGGWGLYADQPGKAPSSYVTNAWQPIPTICNEGQVGPFGIASVATFNAPAGVSNPPPPGPGHVAPRQTATLDAGSSGLLTVSGASPRTLDLSGSLEIELSSCNAHGCAVSLSDMEVTAAPFNFEGYAIQHLRLTARDAATGGLQGNTLAFGGFSGEFEVRLQDGRYDFVPASTGALLANWDRTTHRFVIAFSFSGQLDDGTTIDLSGSAFGSIVNTSPTAKIAVTSPTLTTSAPEAATIECSSPAGTSVELDGSSSTDAEDATPKLAWYVNDLRLSTAAQLPLDALPLGDTSVQLMAYDSLGYATNDRLALHVVDTTPPAISATDLCISPPNHSTVLLTLGQELAANALDMCDGTSTASLRIVDVTSSAGEGVIRWGPHEVCLTAERAGQETSGRIYDIKVEATDSHGNVVSHIVHVTIPHGQPQGCLKTQRLPTCS